MSKAARLSMEMAGGGKIIGPSAKSVFIGKVPAALVGDTIQPHYNCPDDSAHCAATIITGSSNVLIEDKQAVRIGDSCSCGHVIEGTGQRVYIN